MLCVLAEYRNAFLDYFFAGIAWLGSEIVSIIVICFLFLCVDKKKAYKLGLVFFFSSAVMMILKMVFRIRRPWEMVADRYPQFRERYSYVDKLSSKAQATGFSFPSGHTQSSTALYGTFFGETKNKAVRLIIVAVIALVAFSRLYLGVHTLLDVLASLFFTLALLVLFELIFEKIYTDKRFDIPVALATAGVSIATIVYVFILYYSGVSDYKMAADSLKMAACGVGFSIGYVVERRYIRFEPKNGTAGEKALRLICGVGGVFLIKEGGKYLGRLIFGYDTLWADITRYFLLMLFGILVLPFLINKIREKAGKSTGELQ